MQLLYFFASGFGGMELFMKLKRIISVVLILCLMFSVCSCKKGADSKQVVDSFMKALSTYDVDAMSKHLEDMPTNGDSVYVYDIFTDGHYVDLYEIANTDRFEYKIVSAKGNTVKVKVTMPDIYTLYKDTFMTVMTNTFANEELLDYILDEDNEPQLLVIALMIDAIENGDVDTVEEEFTLKIGNINGETKIMVNDQLEQLMTSKLCLSQKDVVAEATDAE